MKKVSFVRLTLIAILLIQIVVILNIRPWKNAEKQNKKSIFLQWLNPNDKKKYTWEETQKNILKLSKIIKENIKEGDRCLLVSENRPEWFVSDLAIIGIYYFKDGNKLSQEIAYLIDNDLRENGEYQIEIIMHL